MAKTINMTDAVVKIEKSGVRFNAWDTDGVKRTSEITSGCRKNAYNGGYLLGRFPANTNSGFSWRKWEGEIASPVVENSTVDVPTAVSYTHLTLPTNREV